MTVLFRVLAEMFYPLNMLRNRLLAVILLPTVCIHHGLKVFEVGQCSVYFMGHMFAQICL